MSPTVQVKIFKTIKSDLNKRNLRIKLKRCALTTYSYWATELLLLRVSICTFNVPYYSPTLFSFTFYFNMHYLLNLLYICCYRFNYIRTNFLGNARSLESNVLTTTSTNICVFKRKLSSTKSY